MNFQEKLFESTAQLRSRAVHFADAALKTARTRANVAAKRIEGLKGSFAVLAVARRDLKKVARRHATRLVKESSAIAADAGKDVTALARSAYAALAKRAAPMSKAKAKARKATTPRRRAAAKAA